MPAETSAGGEVGDGGCGSPGVQGVQGAEVGLGEAGLVGQVAEQVGVADEGQRILGLASGGGLRSSASRSTTSIGSPCSSTPSA